MTCVDDLVKLHKAIKAIYPSTHTQLCVVDGMCSGKPLLKQFVIFYREPNPHRVVITNAVFPEHLLLHEIFIHLMLIRSLASNYLKSIRRSRFARSALTIKIFAIVFLWIPLYLYAILLGLFVDLIFNVDMPMIANQVILYFFVFWSVLDILLRTRISFPLSPYLMTPITRRRLALFYQAISAFGKINLLPFLFAFSFWFKNFLLQDIPFSWIWLLLFLSLSVCFHLLANLLRISLDRRYLPLFFTLLFVIGLTALEWRYNIPTLSALSTMLFEATLVGAVWPLAIMLVAGMAVFHVSTGQIVQGLYVDDMAFSRPKKQITRKKITRSYTDEMLSFEWKLVWRNRRTRILLFFIPYMIFYGICTVIFSAVMPDTFAILNLSFSLIMPIFICMIFVGNALNFRSVFYDSLMSKPISINNVLMIMLYISNIIFFVYFSIMAIFIYIIYDFSMFILPGYLFLYSLGIKYIIPYTWIFDARRIKLNDNAFGNISFHFRQNWWVLTLCGVSIIFLPPLFIILLPGIHYGGIVVGALGLVGLLLRSRWIDAITKNIERKRYVLMEEFRKG